MSPGSLLRAVAAGGAVCLLSGCLVPRGEPVAVDHRAGRFWNGDGVMLESTADGEHCRVALRGRSLLVERHWVPCRYVHPRTPR